MFENNLTLCRLIFRRDRLRILFWFIGIMFLVVGFGGAVPGMYPTEPERLAMAETMKSPAMVVMLGPVYDSGGMESVSSGSINAIFGYNNLSANV